jgi:hypothetical protein
MKKHITMILLIFVILSSCTAPTEQSQETTSDTTAAVIPSPIVVPQSKEIEMKVTKGVVVTTKYPYITDAYRKSGQNPKNIDYILRMNLGESDALDEDLFFSTHPVY